MNTRILIPMLAVAIALPVAAQDSATLQRAVETALVLSLIHI